MLSKFGQKKIQLVIKKWFACLLLGLLPCGCADVQHAGHEQKKPFYEIERDHPLGLVQKEHLRLTDSQMGKITQYGVKISEEERIIYQ